MATRWFPLALLDTYIMYMAVCQNLVPLVNIKIAGKWMFIPLKMVLIGINPYPYHLTSLAAQGNTEFCTLSADRSFKRLPFSSASRAQMLRSAT